MNCSKCGKEVKEGLKFCTNCGEKIAEINDISESQKDSSGKEPIDKMALIALICGIVGALIYPLIGIIGIILGVISTKKAINDRSKKYAKRAIYVGIIDILILIILLGI